MPEPDKPNERKISLQEQKKQFEKELDELEKQLLEQYSEYQKYLEPQVYREDPVGQSSASKNNTVNQESIHTQKGAQPPPQES